MRRDLDHRVEKLSLIQVEKTMFVSVEMGEHCYERCPLVPVVEGVVHAKTIEESGSIFGNGWILEDLSKSDMLPAEG